MKHYRLSIVNQWFFGCIYFLVQFMSLANFWIFFSNIFSALCAQLKTMLPVGFFEEQTAREIADIAKLPLPIARAMIHAEDESVYDDFDDQQILARRLQLAEFIKNSSPKWNLKFTKMEHRFFYICLFVSNNSSHYYHFK